MTDSGRHPTGSTSIGWAQRLRRDSHLVRLLAPRELRIRYRQSSVNILWAFITPVAVLLVYGLVLTQTFGVTTSCAPYLVSAWAGLVVWTFFASSVGSAVNSMVQSADLMQKLYFPREALPMSAVAAATLELLVGLVALVVITLIAGVPIGWNALWSVVPLLLVLIWTTAVSILVAVLAAFTRDVVHGVSLLLRVGFFATTVMYEAEQVPPAMAWSVELNPLSVAITELRNSLFCDLGPSWRLLGIHLVVAVLLLVGSLLYSRSVETRIVDVV